MSRPIASTIIVWFLLVVTSVGALAQSIEAPLRRGLLGHYLIEVSINGQGPFTLAVDTAASATVFSGELIEALGIAPIPGASISVGAVGGSVMLDFYQISSIGFGEDVLTDIRVAGSAESSWPDFEEDVHAVLGVDVIGDFLPAFLESEGVFQLLPTDTELSHRTEDWDTLDLVPAIAGLYFVNTEINGAPVSAVFDTGAARNMMNRAAAAAAGFTHGDARLSVDPKPLSGLDGQGTDAFLANDVAITWAGSSFEPQTVSIADIPIFVMLGMRDEALVLGAPMFGGRDFIVDYVADVVYIEPLETNEADEASTH